MKTPCFERSKRKPEVLSGYVLSNTVTCKLDPLQKAIVEFSHSTSDENDSTEFVETTKCKVCRFHLLSLKRTVWLNRVIVGAFGFYLNDLNVTKNGKLTKCIFPMVFADKATANFKSGETITASLLDEAFATLDRDPVFETADFKE
ncbi:unnamed protein product [Linum trigynum]|uniref:Uncharacterized protein n=1 Tax=Linum trigynum TaxID=586398 RepID=A0AAV2FSB8_9ROSI